MGTKGQPILVCSPSNLVTLLKNETQKGKINDKRQRIFLIFQTVYKRNHVSQKIFQDQDVLITLYGKQTSLKES